MYIIKKILNTNIEKLRLNKEDLNPIQHTDLTFLRQIYNNIKDEECAYQRPNERVGGMIGNEYCDSCKDYFEVQAYIIYDDKTPMVYLRGIHIHVMDTILVLPPIGLYITDVQLLQKLTNAIKKKSKDEIISEGPKAIKEELERLRKLQDALEKQLLLQS